MHNTDYFAMFGGGDGMVNFLDVQFYNIAQKQWDTNAPKIYMPSSMADIRGVIGSRMDSDGCDMMILFGWPSQSLYVCTGVNFINILFTNFLYERHFSSFFYVHLTREKLPKQNSYKIFLHKMLRKFTTIVNFINILLTNSSYERRFGSFHVTREDNICTKNARLV